ncbi:MAG: HAMP domain-containing protein [Magnetococcales bacterium]|nr:HAMP domain-containing protein [Magnetococcales bacterium]
MTNTLHQTDSSLLTKMMVRSFLVLSLSIFFIEFLTYNQSSEQVIQLIQERQEKLTALYAERYDRTLKAIELDLLTIRSLPTLKAYGLNRQYNLQTEADQALSDLSDFLVRHYQRNPAYALIRILDNRHQEVLSILNGTPKRIPTKTLEGIPLSEPIPPPFDGLQDRGIQETPALKGGALVYAMGWQINGLFHGSIEIYFHLDSLVEELARERLFERGFMGVYSKDGRIIYDPAHPFNSQLDQKRPTLLAKMAHSPFPGTWAFKTTDQTDYLFSGAAMTFKPWVIVALVPKEELLSGLNQTRQIITYLVLLAIFLDFALVYTFTRNLILKPVDHLLLGMRRIISGEKKHRIHLDSHDEFGHLAFVFNAMADRLQKREEELSQLNAELENRVLARTEDYRKALEDLKTTQDQLIQSSKLASLGTLATGIAHEIRQPLTIISLTAENATNLIDDNDYDLESAYLVFKKVMKNCARINHIIDHLRSFARKGETQNRQAVDLVKVVESSFTLLEQQFSGRGVTINQTVTANLPPTFGNANQLEQVLINLLSNARDALEGVANPTLTIDISQEENRIILSVEDNGPGIDETVQGEIFDPFFTTKEVGKGTGLGLSISHGIIEDHGGTITVSNTHGRGARFVLTLPVYNGST